MGNGMPTYIMDRYVRDLTNQTIATRCPNHDVLLILPSILTPIHPRALVNCRVLLLHPCRDRAVVSEKERM